MSELETSMPSRADIMSVIGGLEGLRPKPAAAKVVAKAAAEAPVITEAPAPVVPVPPVVEAVSQAAQAKHDQDAAALRDMTTDRDAWRTAAQKLQAELWRQMDVLRAEAEQERAQAEALRLEVEQHRAYLQVLHADGELRDGQIAHLSAAMTALIELAQTRPAAMPAAPTAFVPGPMSQPSPFTTPGPLAAAAPAPTPVAPPQPVVAPQPVAVPDPVAAPEPAATGYSLPPGMEGIPSTQPAPPPVDPAAPPMVIPSLAPDPRPPAKPKPRRPAPAAARAAAAPTEPVVETPAEPLPPVVEFTAPVPAGGGGEILPSGGSEKKRRLRLG